MVEDEAANDPAAHGQKSVADLTKGAKPADNPYLPWTLLASTAQSMGWCVIAAAVVAGAGAIAMIWIGGQVGEVGDCGSYSGDCVDVAFQYRPTGFLLLGLVVLLAPPGYMVCRGVERWCRSNIS